MASHQADSSPRHSGLGHVVPVWLLAAVFTGLLLLTGLTVAVAQVDLGNLNLYLALGIAAAKASLVVLFFMHLFWDRPFNSMVFIGCLLFVSLFIGITLTDQRASNASAIGGEGSAMQGVHRRWGVRRSEEMFYLMTGPHAVHVVGGLGALGGGHGRRLPRQVRPQEICGRPLHGHLLAFPRCRMVRRVHRRLFVVGWDKIRGTRLRVAGGWASAHHSFCCFRSLTRPRSHWRIISGVACAPPPAIHVMPLRGSGRVRCNDGNATSSSVYSGFCHQGTGGVVRIVRQTAAERRKSNCRGWSGGTAPRACERKPGKAA